MYDYFEHLWILYLMHNFISLSFLRKKGLVKKDLVDSCCMKDAMQNAWGMMADTSLLDEPASGRNVSTPIFVSILYPCLHLPSSTGIGLGLFKKLCMSIYLFPPWSCDISLPLNCISSSIMTFLTLYLRGMSVAFLLRFGISPRTILSSVTYT